MAVIRFSVITNIEEFEGLAHAWDRLVPAESSVFHTFLWNYCYAKYLLEFDLFVVVAKTEQEIVGISPLQRHGEQAMSLCHHLADHGRLMVSSNLELSVLMPVLRSENIASLYAKSINESECSFLLASGDEVLRRESIPCPVLDLHAPEADTLSPRLLMNVDQMERKIARELGKLELAVTAPTQETIEAFFKLNAAWRATRQQSPLADTPSHSRFFHDVLPELAGKRQAWFSFMLCNGNPVSALLYFAYGDTVAYYASGHDPALSCFSPGSVHLTRFIRKMRDLGFRWLDFLRGEEQYKYRFGAKDRYTVNNLCCRLSGVRPGL